jgi:hypothetical protein
MNAALITGKKAGGRLSDHSLVKEGHLRADGAHSPVLIFPLPCKLCRRRSCF